MTHGPSLAMDLRMSTSVLYIREATGCSMSVPQKKLLGFSSSGRMGFSSKSSTTSPLRPLSSAMRLSRSLS